MTQIFDQDGKVYPVTLVSASPSTVLQVKGMDKDGYTAVQVGFGDKKENKISKPQRGHYKNLGNFKFVKEFKVDDTSSFAVGNKIDLSIFSVGDKVEISGTSKGKGFQGVVKRHGFKGGRRSHGQKHSEREAGSIGGGGRAGGRVTKGMRMAGRMGSDRITIKNLKLVSVDKENNILAVLGAIPGKRGTLLEIKQK